MYHERVYEKNSTCAIKLNINYFSNISKYNVMYNKIKVSKKLLCEIVFQQ